MSSIYADDTNITDDDVIDDEVIDDDTSILDDVTDDVDVSNDSVEGSHIKTFTDLYNQVNNTQEGSILNLTEDYKFNSTSDESFINGIPITKNITIIGSNNTVYIDGSRIARGFCIDSNCHVVLENIIFKNCYCKGKGGGIYLNSTSALTVNNCGFYSNYVYNSDGGAIYCEDGTDVEIHNTNFYKNVATRFSNLTWSEFKSGMGSAITIQIGSILRIYESVFVGNRAGLATILVNSLNDSNKENKISKLHVDNCLFENNTSGSSGVIYLDELGKGEILNSVFRRNSATYYGGPVILDTCYSALVKNCLFEENTGISGGAIYIGVFSTVYRSNVRIVDCNFTKNTASKDGGAIHSRWGVVQISGCNFDSNTANDFGGAISAAKGTIRISDSNFINNTSPKGGALSLETDQSSVLKSAFYNNVASKYGGAIYSAKDYILVSDSKFYNNHAISGGALFLESKMNYVLKSVFNENIASSYGGAIFSRQGPIRVSDSQFNSNSATSGGALYLQNEKVYVLNSKFNKNVASKYGGAIFSKVESVSSSGCSYVKNSAQFGKDVYGIFNIEVKQYKSKSGPVRLKIMLTSPWKMPLSQKIKFTFKGTKPNIVKWFKTNSNGVLILMVSNIKLGKNLVTTSMDCGVCNVKSWDVVDYSIIYYQKQVKKPASIRITVKTKTDNKVIKNTKFQVKIYTGKKYKTLNVKTNSKGIFYLATKNLTKGNHQILVILNNNKYEINNKFTVKVI